MKKVSGSCKVNLLYFWVIFVIIGYVRSAPSGSKAKHTAAAKVGHRIKRCENLINILSNMLLEQFPPSNWEDFVEVSNDEDYPIIDWNEQGFKYPKDAFKNNFILYKDQSDTTDSNKRFGSRLNYNYHQPPKGIKQDAYFYEKNHQPSKSNPNKFWENQNIGNYGHGLMRDNNPVEEHFPDYMDDSSSDWHEVLPSRRIIEIDEAIWKNFFKTPPYFSVGIPKPLVDPPVRTKESIAPNWIKSLTGNSVHRCIHDHSKDDLEKSIINGTDLKNIANNIKDEYFVLLIKKDQLFGDERKEHTTKVEDNESFKTQMEIVGKDTPILTTTESETTSTEAHTEADEKVVAQTSTVAKEINNEDAKDPIVGSVVITVEENYGKEQTTETGQLLSTSTNNDIAGYETTTTDPTTEFISYSSTESGEIESEGSETTLQTTTIENTTESIKQSSISYSSTQLSHESVTENLENTTSSASHYEDQSSGFEALDHPSIYYF